MRTVAFVPVKLNNERLPGKNVMQFSDGTPLLHFVQRSLCILKNEGVIDQIYIYCSSEDVCRYMLDGVEYLSRPHFLDCKETIGREIYEEFVKNVRADVYVLAHATSPFVKVDHIRDCIRRVQTGQYDSAFCAKKIQNFLWKYEKPLNFDLENPQRTQDMVPIYMELSTPYIFTWEGFQLYHSRTGVHPYICECGEIESIDIDYPEDFELANIIYTKLLLNKLKIES